MGTSIENLMMRSFTQFVKSNSICGKSTKLLFNLRIVFDANKGLGARIEARFTLLRSTICEGVYMYRSPILRGFSKNFKHF